MSDITTTQSATQPTATLPPGYTAPANSETEQQASTNGINSQTFLQLLVAQLQYQNPDDPVDSTEFLSQTASFEEVQQLDSLQTSMTSLVSAQQASAATSMLGNQIEGTDANGNAVTGVVSGVQLTTNGPILTVGNDTVPFANVTSVTAPGSATSSSSTGTTGTTGTTGSTTTAGSSGTTGSTTTAGSPGSSSSGSSGSSGTTSSGSSGSGGTGGAGGTSGTSGSGTNGAAYPV